MVSFQTTNLIQTNSSVSCLAIMDYPAVKTARPEREKQTLINIIYAFNSTQRRMKRRRATDIVSV
jgi:hypothetical protein